MLKCAKACLVIVALASPLAHAAGLGRITVTSVPGQPFKAEIDLVAVKKEEKSSLTARLPSQETFRQANVDYLPVLSTFQATIEMRADGWPYVKIVSPQVVVEPLLNILIELNWSSGRLLREYTVVLPQDENEVNTPAKQAVHPSSTGSAKVEPAIEKSPPSARHDVKLPLIAESVPSAGVSPISYGPVNQGDTLAGIAKNIVAPSGASLNQVLVALHRANPGAFIGNNMHQLKAGSSLRIPDTVEIGAISPVEANGEVQLQTTDWRQRRFAPVAEVTEELKQTVTGTIDRAVGADSVTAREPARELLRLSKGAEPRSGDEELANRGGNLGEKHLQHPSAQDRLHAMEEDAIAKDRALREANERIALLEKNIKELQHLLELKNLALAEMQKRAEAVQTGATPVSLRPEVIAPQEESGRITDGASVAAARLSPANVEERGSEHTAASQVAAPERVELAKPAQLARLTHEANPASRAETRTRGTSFYDDLMANFEYLGGALVLLITGIVGVSMVRGSRSSSVFDSDVYGDSSATVVQPRGNSRDTLVSQEANAAAGCEEVDSESCVKPHLTSISLNMPDARFAAYAKAEIAESSTERDTRWHEMITKLDLARAYQEMGDRESARQILQEVIREGDERQRENAGVILASL